VFDMSAKRYAEEFKIEAVRQVTDRGYKINDVSLRLGVTSKSLRDWIKKYGDSSSQHQEISSQQNEVRRLKAELRRITEERNILKEAAAFFACESRKSTHS
jgi:transposase